MGETMSRTFAQDSTSIDLARELEAALTAGRAIVQVIRRREETDGALISDKQAGAFRPEIAWIKADQMPQE